MSFRIAQRSLSGTAEAWDPDDPEPFTAFTSGQWVRQDGDVAVVLNGDGQEQNVWPGWLALRLDARPGGPVILVSGGSVGDEPDSLFRTIPGDEAAA